MRFGVTDEFRKDAVRIALLMILAWTREGNFIWLYYWKCIPGVSLVGS